MNIAILTAITQIGGVIYLFCLGLTKFLRLSWKQSLLTFVVLYMIGSLILIPIIAPIYGRTALPMSGNLKPLNFGTCILNRHYVKTRLKSRLIQIANEMDSTFEGTKTSYLDANFPFFDGFPLLPHLSHNDGRKVDLAFYYKNQGKRINSSPSFIGYGIYEEPSQGESNYPERCKKQGFWQYGFLKYLAPVWNKSQYELDTKRTQELIRLLATDELTSKIFIEPHLKDRWNLSRYDKIRFHGCQAVRHDDHIHFQIK